MLLKTVFVLSICTVALAGKREAVHWVQDREDSFGDHEREAVRWVQDRQAEFPCGVRDPSALANYNLPWQVTVLAETNEGIRRCAGSIISSRWVLTAGQCIAGTNHVFVATSRYNGSANSIVEQGSYVAQKRWLGDYDATTKDNDIALLGLRTPLKFNSNVRPVCLPFGQEDILKENPPSGTVAAVSTDTSCGITVDKYWEASLSLYDAETCRAYLPDVTDRMMCGWGGSYGPIANDIGSPLTWERDGVSYQLGIASIEASYGSGDIGQSGVYTLVTAFLPWIQSNTGIYSNN